MAPLDVHGTLGGIYECLRNLRGPMDGPNEPSGCGMETVKERKSAINLSNLGKFCQFGPGPFIYVRPVGGPENDLC